MRVNFEALSENINVATLCLGCIFPLPNHDIETMCVTLYYEINVLNDVMSLLWGMFWPEKG